jgi:methylase of polypeptide subunit release factors
MPHDLDVPQNLDLIESFDLAAALHVLRPSEYTAALIQTLRGMGRFVRGAAVLDVGSGSGVVLAAMAGLGATSLCGIDSEAQAIRTGEILLGSVGATGDFHRGDLWQPVAGRRFDLVISNLPHFPTDCREFPGRLPSWSHGGQDGRRLLDPFLDDLAAHLTPSGRAVITHNAFVGLAETRRRLALHGLQAAIRRTVMLALPNEKLKVLTPEIRAREEGRTIHSIGAYSFAQMHVLDIRTARTDR